MKKQYDFSKGVKGKFYVPASEIELPIYLDKENQKYFLNLAKEKKVKISKLINKVLSKDRKLIESVISK
ncbi:MAG: hypothetical protein IT569_00765 [Leptospiraceae bacterium]|nr:hypothetical protein [Leptospiraceae bacterium]